MTIRADAKSFIHAQFPELSPLRIFTSRRYEAKDKPSYYDDWWFVLPLKVLEETEFVVFAGVNDLAGAPFQLFKVPTNYISSNLGKLDVRPDQKVWMYIEFKSFDEIRKNAGVSFRPYAVN
jgi:hypothetical protein